MQTRLIKTDADYQRALARIETLFDAKPGTSEGDELDLLATLVDLYEKQTFPIGLPSPVAAIRFRMEQQGLKNKDLIPFFGSASKVSEVLSGERALSKTMIRNLITGLGIPAEVLLQEPGSKLKPDGDVAAFKKFPLSEMVKRGWFPGFSGTLTDAKSQLEDLAAAFVGVLGSAALTPAFNRQNVRSGKKCDEHALTAWRIRVMSLAQRESLPPYTKGTLTHAFLAELVRLSYLDDGPKLAREFLNKSGIHLVFERHLPKTYLDGAAMKLPDGSPVIALSLRIDRLDNFWFTLFHELAHVAQHLDKDGIEVFFDDLTEKGKTECENEADAFASDALIPDSKWKGAGLTKHSSPFDVYCLAASLRISPAIPAGRLRFEAHDYTLFKNMIGTGKVRTMFVTTGN
jgi:HTH-type transcriptional regulator/antitoxin HigA